MPKPTCSVEQCVRIPTAKGFCDMHYARWVRHGDPGPTERLRQSDRPPERPCILVGCDQIARSRGWCSKHYERWRKHGDPTICLTDRDLSPIERFRRKYIENKTSGCWIWTAGISDGYAQFWDGKTNAVAHRWAYEYFVGPIPAGLHIDHLCGTTYCVRPDHLEPVTPEENALRGASPLAINARKTHCDNGHSFDEENTFIRRSGRRRCKTCARLHRAKKNRERGERLREERLACLSK